jgi:hypothetical protein
VAARNLKRRRADLNSGQAAGTASQLLLQQQLQPQRHNYNYNNNCNHDITQHNSNLNPAQHNSNYPDNMLLTELLQHKHINVHPNNKLPDNMPITDLLHQRTHFHNDMQL